MNFRQRLELMGIKLHPDENPINEGLLQSPEKSKLAKSTQELIMTAKKPKPFVAEVMANEIAVAIEALLGVKDVKGLSQTIIAKSKEIAEAYLYTVDYPDSPESLPQPAAKAAENPEEAENAEEQPEGEDA